MHRQAICAGGSQPSNERLANAAQSTYERLCLSCCSVVCSRCLIHTSITNPHLEDDVDMQKGKGKAEVPEENLTLLKFCTRIMATAAAIDRSLEDTKGAQFMERLRASLPRAPTSSKQKAEDHDMLEEQPWEGSVRELDQEEVQKIYLQWANLARFEYCDLSIQAGPAPAPAPDRDAAVLPGGLVHTPAPTNEASPVNYKFFYNNEARMLYGTDLPKRSLAIAKEVRSILLPNNSALTKRTSWLCSLLICPSPGAPPFSCALMRRVSILSKRSSQALRVPRITMDGMFQGSCLGQVPHDSAQLFVRHIFGIKLQLQPAQRQIHDRMWPSPI